MLLDLYSTLLTRVEVRPVEYVAPVVIRPIRPDDEGKLGAFFRGLSDRSRHRRFHAVMNDLPADVLARFVRPDGCDEVALVAVMRRLGGESVIGEVRYAIIDGKTRKAEFAIAVADVAQGIGLGKRLLRGLMRRATENKVAVLYGDVLPENQAMLALAREFGFRQRRDPHDPRLLLVEKSLEAARLAV
jgi:acetyltransferase